MRFMKIIRPDCPVEQWGPDFTLDKEGRYVTTYTEVTADAYGRYFQTIEFPNSIEWFELVDDD